MSTESISYKIVGLDCASCAKSVETGINQLEGVESCTLNFSTEKLQIYGHADREAVIQRVQSLGFDVATEDDSAPPTPPLPDNFWQFMGQRADTRLALIGAGLILPGLFLTEIGQLEHWGINLLSLGAMVTAGYPVARSAMQALRLNREININVLMTIAALGAVLIGAYTEAGMVMVLFAFGEALEGYTTNRARNSIRSLLEVVPNTATRICPHDGDEESVPIKQLRVGDVIVVKPGERIPMDGRVKNGSSWVNQAPITGESKLLEKQADDTVFASTINGEGVLEVEVTHLASDNTISRLIQMVEEAQEKRAPSQRFIDWFARYYTPAVVVLAMVVAIIPPVFFGQPFWNTAEGGFGWLYRGLALLVVACPCALVISTPVSLISAISNATRQGVLIKGGAYLETLSHIKAIAFDKTGTLTEGQPQVVAVRSAACTNHNGSCNACDEVIALASAVERRSEHPLAVAVMAEAERRNLQQRYPSGDMVRAITGKGVVGQVDGREVLIGSHSYFDAAINHAETHCAAAQADAAQGHTPLMVQQNGAYLGTITVADTVRQSSRETVATLKKAGVSHLVMLTGDNQAVAESIAAEVGVTEVKAELLPEDKVKAVQALQRQYGQVAMVGDGINDTPALATADVGIAIGGASGGTNQAMETADIIIMRDSLIPLAFLISLSRATMRTIQANVFFSIAIKLLFMGLVLLGWGTMWMAVLADVGTSLLVTLHGMRLARYRG